MTVLGWVARRLGWVAAPTPGSFAIAGYLALSRLPGVGGILDHRLALLAGALAAELGGCRWCIDRARHDSRLAGIPLAVLGQLRSHSTCPGISQRERVALSFVQSLSCGASDEAMLAQARQFFTEGELAELTAIVAEHHCVESSIYGLA
jgi:hypothetical protein